MDAISHWFRIEEIIFIILLSSFINMYLEMATRFGDCLKKVIIAFYMEPISLKDKTFILIRVANCYYTFYSVDDDVRRISLSKNVGRFEDFNLSLFKNIFS